MFSNCTSLYWHQKYTCTYNQSLMIAPFVQITLRSQTQCTITIHCTCIQYLFTLRSLVTYKHDWLYLHSKLVHVYVQPVIVPDFEWHVYVQSCVYVPSSSPIIACVRTTSDCTCPRKYTCVCAQSRFDCTYRRIYTHLVYYVQWLHVPMILLIHMGAQSVMVTFAFEIARVQVRCAVPYRIILEVYYP